MAKWYRKNIGLVNVLMIALICASVGLLSILSLASKAQADEWHEHAVQFFFNRMGILMMVSVVLTAILVALNVVYNLIHNLKEPRHWHTNVVPVVLWCSIICFVFSVGGTLVLLG